MVVVEHGEAILEQARDTLLLGGVDLRETRDIPYGWQLRGADGEIVNIYMTGKAVAQGKRAAAVKALFDARPLPALPRAAASSPRTAATPRSTENPAVADVRLPYGWSDHWGPGDVPF